MKDKTSILFISRSSKMYGAQRSLVALVKGLKDLGCECRVLTSSRGTLSDALNEINVEYLIVPFKNWLYQGGVPAKLPYRSAFNLHAAGKIARQLRGNPVDLIYTNTIVSPFGGLLALLLGKPHIWHIRESVRRGLNAKYDFGMRASMMFVERTSRKIICNSNEIRDELSSFLPEEKLSVVYNGIIGKDDLKNAKQKLTKRKPPYTNQVIKLCILGTLSENKGQADAIGAVSALKKRGIKAELRIVGTGGEGYSNKLGVLSERLSVNDSVVFEDWVENPFKVYETSDVCLVCSRHESFGRVAAEAMSAGCPVVSSCAGGQREFVFDGENALCYPQGDSEALADRVERLVKDEKLYFKVINNAFSLVCGRFLMETSVSSVHNIILDCIGAAEP